MRHTHTHDILAGDVLWTGGRGELVVGPAVTSVPAAVIFAFLWLSSDLFSHTARRIKNLLKISQITSHLESSYYCYMTVFAFALRLKF